jgi:outer membrane protein OmpA-like peptidoglycan-associated protein
MRGQLTQQLGISPQGESPWAGVGYETGGYGYEWETPPVSPSPGSRPPSLDIVSTRPGIEMVDYLDATVIARGKVRVPTKNIKFLARLDPVGKPTWWKRLWKKAEEVAPMVRVTIELIQVGPSLTPVAHYQDGFIFKDGLEEYSIRLHTKLPPCDVDYAPAIGSAFRIETARDIERDLGLATGQLDTLLRTGKIGTPLSATDKRRLFWIVYATFPDSIKNFVIPRSRIVLDEFVFDKDNVTRIHLDKLRAIASHIAAITNAAGLPPKIALTGHTDERGTDAYNLDLGERRIKSVEKALRDAIDDIAKGASTRFTITSKSFGESKHVFKAARTEAEHARNRRVEVLLSDLRPRCKRVSLRAVVERSRKLLPRLTDKQADRIKCFLEKVLKKGTDDRYVHPQLVLDVYNKMTPFGTYPLGLLRDQLTLDSVFGPKISDVSILKSLQWIDDQIIAGITEMNKYIAILSGAGSAGIPLIPLMKAMDALRAFMDARVKDPNSIYNCYKDV